MNSVVISAKNRQDIGTKGANAVRKEGFIPAVVYGGSLPTHISITAKDLKPLLFTPDFKLANVSIDGKDQKCILKSVQYHPVSNEVIHVDFLRLIDGHKINVEIPVKFKGTSPGVKAGGKLVQVMRKLKVKTTPDKLIDEIVVDISHLELGHVLRIKDVEQLEGIEIIAGTATPIANIEIPRALKSAAAAEAKAKNAPGKKK